MSKDPIVEEIHKFRQEFAARFNHDMDAMAREIKRLERESGRPLVSYANEKSPKKRSSTRRRQKVKQ